MSDASLAVVVRESTVWEPLDELAPEAHVPVRSHGPVDAQLADLLALLDRRLGQLGAGSERQDNIGAGPDDGQPPVLVCRSN